MPSNGSAGFKVVASVLVFLVVAGLAEAVSRWIGPQAPDLQLGKGWIALDPHPTRLWGLAPGRIADASFAAYINAMGIRGPLPATPKPRGVSRIIMLGDSTIFGHGVADDQVMAPQLEAALTSYGLKVDVVNFGVPGYSTEQSLIQLEEQGWELEPDLLVIANLWSDNDFSAFHDADLLRTRRLFVDNVLGRSAFFRLLAGFIDRARGGEGAHIVTWMRSSRWPKNGVRRVPLADYIRNLDRMVREARSRDVGVAFLALCNPIRLRHEDRHAPWRVYFEAQAEVAAHHHVPDASVCDAFEASGASADNLFVDQMHFTALGNRIAAKALAETLVRAGWPLVHRLLGSTEPFHRDDLVDRQPRAPISRFTRTNSPQRWLFQSNDASLDTAPNSNP